MMKLSILMVSATALMFAQASDAAHAPVVGSAYALKDLTLSGVLLVAVAYLFRQNQALNAETKAFVKEQAEASKETVKTQNSALAEVASALGKQQAALDAQIVIYREHINAIIESHTNAKRRDDGGG